MKLITKLALGAALLVTASAATFPNGLGEMLGSYPASVQQREALKLCQAHNPAFIRFVAAERRECYRQMSPVFGTPANFGGASIKADAPSTQN